MRDLAPETYPDGDADSQLRYIQQQMAETSRAKSVANGNRRVERHAVGDLIALAKYQREESNRSTRMRSALSRHKRQ